MLNLRLDSGNMIFNPMPTASVSGVIWRVTGVNNGQGGVASVVSGTQLTATFADDGTLAGDTGCNSYRGSYTLAGSAITVGPLVTTRRACRSETVAVQERAFLAAMSATSTYELVGDRMTLRDADGATQLSLVRPTLSK